MAEFRAVITVPFDCARTSLNQRLHWRERANRNRAAKEAARLAWHTAGCPRAPGKVQVGITVRRGRGLDPDNALSGCKPVIDSLFKQAITPDDSRRWVSFRPVEQEIGKRWREAPEIVFEVEGAEDA